MPRPSLYQQHREAVLVLIAESQHGTPPTVRQLGRVLGVSVASAHHYLTKLAAEGCVRWQPHERGTLRCTPAGLAQAQAARAA